jgi:outer membrane lipoprotein SlyB
MNYPRIPLQFAALTLATALSLSGCKSNQPTQNAQSATPQQPAAQQPAPEQQPAAQPAAPAQQAAASQPQATQPAAPVAQPAAAPVAQPAAAPAPPPPPPPPPQPVEYVLPAGTTISVHTDTELSSKESKPNQGFTASVADSIHVKGTTVILRGARAEGVVVDAKNQGKIKGEGYLSIRLTRVRTKWGSYQISTATIDNTQKGKGKRTAVTTGGGAGVGALIGGLAGGGKGAGIGALAGAGAGFVGGAFTGNKEIKLPAESLLTFQLTEPVTIHVSKQTEDQEPQLQQPPADQQPPQQ